jgi:cell division protein FtsI (penicillin-binding protein 3)
VSLPWMSIGYEVMMTPMQTLAFYNAIANDGRLMQPQFVRSITRAGREVERFEPVTIQQRICSDATLAKIREVLKAVVDSGTATNLGSAHFSIAGKTGTAQIASGRTGYKQKGVVYQASFVGYFPADRPIYSCIVVVSSPTSSGYYGNVVAGPIFQAIADKIYSNRIELQSTVAEAGEIDRRAPITFSGQRADLLSALTSLGIGLQEEGEGEWVSTTAGDSSVRISARGIPDDGMGLVPNVLGMGLKDALYILENRGLRVRANGSGMVKRQSLAPGSRCFQGSTITIELGA